ncbi:MAG: DNA primase [Candidatus Omnitrophica bacterium]|nr:DNA primase [Candidatus Omnitrophota bacterium]
MGLISEDIIRGVIDRADIIDVIGRYVTLKKYGSNFKALCPFHTEKSPSFVVNPDKQIFHCFGCNVGGNVVSFIMRQERLEFPQAVRFLAEQMGIVIPDDQEDASSPSKKIKDDIYKINDWALQFFHERLLTSREPTAQKAREYLKARGVDLEIVKQFQIGYAPDEWDALIGVLRSKGVSPEVMHQAGVVIARDKGGYYDRFRGRIIFPIFDINSRPVAFGARAMNDTEGAKYINSPETPVYTKGRHLFGLNMTKTSVGDEDVVLVVEGYMDMIMPYIHGVKNIAASLGTALTVDQIKLIRRYTSNVTMLFDTDPAGQSAIVRSLDLLVDEGMNVKVATLSQGEDPDSFIRQQGLEAFRGRLKQAQTLFDYKFSWLSAQFDVKTIEGKDKICQEMLATIGHFKSEVSKFELMRLLAQRLNVPEEIIIKQAKGQIKFSSVPTRTSVKEVISPAPVKINQTPKAHEELLIALFLIDHRWAEEAAKLVELTDFTEGFTRDLVATIWQMTQENLEWKTSDLLASLSSEVAQSFISRLLNDAGSRTSEAPRLFQDCIGRIHKDRLKIHKQELMEKLKEAERRGDTSVVEELRARFQEILKP